MARVAFTNHLSRWAREAPSEVAASTVREALDAVFARAPSLRGYVLDDQGRLRKHVVVFVDGSAIGDRDTLADRVSDASEIYVMQALSGG